VVSATDDKAKRISYAQMIGGKYFNVQLDWNKQYGNALYAPGKAQPKNPKDHKIVASRSSAKTSRRRCSRKKTSAPMSKCRHGAWPHDPSGRRRLGAGESGRSLDQGHPRRASRLGQRLPRRRRTKEWDAIKAAES